MPTRRSSVTIPLCGGLDLDAVLYMGQTFCWEPSEDGHVGAADGVRMRVLVEGDALRVEGSADEERLTTLASRFFDAELDLPALQRELSVEPHVAAAIRRFPGLRVLRQPFWECLAGFILSSANNIKRIQRIVRRLSQAFGDQIDDARLGGWAFPPPERLVDEPLSALYDCGTGFRAKALQEAARAIADGVLDETELRRLPLDDARERLTRLHGVGEKIADCVLLYSLDHTAAFPLDVWMRWRMEQLYFDGRRTPLPTIQAFARERFGEKAGYAQMCLFHDARIDDSAKHRPTSENGRRTEG